MNDTTGDGKAEKGSRQDDRKARLAAELRANLQRRKAQARLRDKASEEKRQETEK
ncbi:MAG: hypothetical protein R3D45_10360 [Rhizobiaceae bacterium]